MAFIHYVWFNWIPSYVLQPNEHVSVVGYGFSHPQTSCNECWMRKEVSHQLLACQDRNPLRFDSVYTSLVTAPSFRYISVVGLSTCYLSQRIVAFREVSVHTVLKGPTRSRFSNKILMDKWEHCPENSQATDSGRQQDFILREVSTIPSPPMLTWGPQSLLHPDTREQHLPTDTPRAMWNHNLPAASLPLFPPSQEGICNYKLL